MKTKQNSGVYDIHMATIFKQKMHEMFEGVVTMLNYCL